MKRITRSLAVAALLCFAALPSQTHAQIVLASYAGATAPAGVSNGPLAWTNSSGWGPVTLDYDGSGAASLTGAEYVTWAQGANAAIGTTTYTTSYTGNLAGYTGTLLVMADDYVSVAVNGVPAGATQPGQYNTVQSFDVPAGAYVDGQNTVSLTVTNTAGYTGVSFLATAVPPPAPAAPLLAVCAAGVSTSCTLPANAVKLGDDGTVVTILTVTAPVNLLYCAGTVCHAPVLFSGKDPFAIGGSSLLGGPLAGGATGSLYLLPGGAVTLTTAVPGPVITVPAAQ